MRNHENIETMIRKETDNPTPGAAARLLKETAPEGATDAVLYKNRAGQWVVMFVPDKGIPNTAQAARVKVSGKRAVATCPL